MKAVSTKGFYITESKAVSEAQKTRFSRCKNREKIEKGFKNRYFTWKKSVFFTRNLKMSIDLTLNRNSTAKTRSHYQKLKQ